MGVTGTLGQVLLTKAYAAGAPAKVAVVGLTQVVFAMGFDVALWGRSLTPAALAGFALVLAPTTWLSIRAARKLGSAGPPATGGRADRPAMRRPRGRNVRPGPSSVERFRSSGRA